MVGSIEREHNSGNAENDRERSRREQAQGQGGDATAHGSAARRDPDATDPQVHSSTCTLLHPFPSGTSASACRR
jgi:hypothetical protein